LTSAFAGASTFFGYYLITGVSIFFCYALITGASIFFGYSLITGASTIFTGSGIVAFYYFLTTVSATTSLACGVSMGFVY
jgi:hypothetical protein